GADVAQQFAQQGLHLPNGVQDIQIGEGHDICGNGQRQQQGPRKRTAGGKVVGGDQPCAAHAQAGDQHADPDEQQGGVAEGNGKNEVQQVRPVVQRALQSVPA